MARGSVQLRHRRACPAKGNDARSCRCGPTAYVVLEGQWAKVGYLSEGWKRADLQHFEDRLSEVRRSLEAGENWRPRKPVKLADYAEGWFEELYRAADAGRISKYTYNNYEGVWENHIKPALGHLPLAAIDPASIRRWEDEKLGSGLKP